MEVDDQKGYISGDYVTISQKLPTASSVKELENGTGVSDTRVSLVQYALQFVGNRYVWGGTSLTNGIDCSGFTMQIYARYGISLPHHAASQPGYGTICFSMVAAAQSVMLVFILVTDRLFMQVTQELELRFRAHIIVHQFVLHDI